MPQPLPLPKDACSKILKMHQYSANVCDNLLIDSVSQIDFNRPMKSTIEKAVFEGGFETSPPHRS